MCPSMAFTDKVTVTFLPVKTWAAQGRKVPTICVGTENCITIDTKKEDKEQW